jgi:RNA polymerase primary sigma factor
MINSNLRLVVSIAKRYQSHDLSSRSDSGGDHRPDPGVEVDWRRGFKLDVRHLVDPSGRPAGVANKSRTIRLPVHIADREQRMARAERALAPRLGRQPTEEEIAEHAKLP